MKWVGADQPIAARQLLHKPSETPPMHACMPALQPAPALACLGGARRQFQPQRHCLLSQLRRPLLGRRRLPRRCARLPLDLVKVIAVQTRSMQRLLRASRRAGVDVQGSIVDGKRGPSQPGQQTSKQNDHCCGPQQRCSPGHAPAEPRQHEHLRPPPPPPPAGLPAPPRRSSECPEA